MRLRMCLGTMLLLALARTGDAREGLGGTIEWSADLNGALAVARQTGRPLMLYFTHDD